LNATLRPSWVNIYLADENGSSRGEGLKLMTSVDDNKHKTIPETHLLARNYPNPFNPSTIISFSIPYDLTNSRTELIVYNIQGEVVKRLVDETLPSGNYLTRWDGRNDLGNQVTSGIYIYSLRVADKQVSGKMTLIK
ncbi:MAG: FlgD immunoglobulin-like domain containing protein, partial [Ignavibacteria bacterium]